jgi:hypothetical protein
LNSPLPPFSFITSSLHSTGIVFLFTYMCTQYLHHIHHPMPFPHLLSLPLAPVTPRQTLFCNPYLQFFKREKWLFCLFKIATKGVSLWHFHVYI